MNAFSRRWRGSLGTFSRPSHIATRPTKIIPCRLAEGQTISQPYIVALMLQALRLSRSDKVLEIGTGSGYLTALLAELTSNVVSIERHEVLAAASQRRDR